MSLNLSGGFTDPAAQSAFAFRALMEAMARPGRIETLTGAMPPAPLSVAAGVTLLTLTDATTPLYLAGSFDRPELRDWIAFHCGAPIVTAEKSRFALGTWADLQPIDRFAIGEPSYPDRSVTLIVESPQLLSKGSRLTGAGIKEEAFLNLPEETAFIENAKLFPLGFDVIFTSGDQVAALPRSTKIGAKACM